MSLNQTRTSCQTQADISHSAPGHGGQTCAKGEQAHGAALGHRRQCHLIRDSYLRGDISVCYMD